MFSTIYCLSLLLKKLWLSAQKLQVTDTLTAGFKSQIDSKHPLRTQDLGEYATHIHDHSADLSHHQSSPLPSIFLTFISSWRDSSWRNLLSVINFSGSHCWKRQKREIVYLGDGEGIQTNPPQNTTRCCSRY